MQVEKFKKDIDLILSAHYKPSPTRNQVRDMLHERVEYHLTTKPPNQPLNSKRKKEQP